MPTKNVLVNLPNYNLESLHDHYPLAERTSKLANKHSKSRSQLKSRV